VNTRGDDLHQIEQPTKCYDFTIKTAKALGLDISNALLSATDELIE
jgi:hypothetical protein